jgi:hypothetical protein
MLIDEIRRFVAFSGGMSSPPQFSLRLDHGDPVEDKALEAQVLVEAAAVWQGIAFQIRAAFIMPRACIRGTQEAHLPGLMDHEQVFDRVALLLATIMVLLCRWSFGPVDQSFSTIMPNRGDVDPSLVWSVARSVVHAAAGQTGSSSCGAKV